MEDTRALQIFRAVAENLSFTRAAEHLLLTQSAVSHQVARLERELGVRLFDRRARSIALTPAGETLLDRSARVFEALRDATDAAKRAGTSNGGRLRIGASATACQYLIPSALREFSECFPAYTLHIAPGDGPEVIDSLKRDQIDLGVVVKLDRGPRLAHHPLFTDELGFLVSSLHPWARTGRVNIEELRDQPLIVYSRSSATFRLIERYFLRMRVELLDPIELGSMEAIKELIKLGLSVGIVSSWIAAAEIEAGSLVWLKLPGTPIRRNWTLAAIAGRRLSLAEQTFVGLCQSVAAELVPRIEHGKSRSRS